MIIDLFRYSDNDLEYFNAVSFAEKNGVDADSFKPSGFNINNDASEWLQDAIDEAASLGKPLIFPKYTINLSGTITLPGEIPSYLNPAGGKQQIISSSNSSYNLFLADGLENCNLINFNLEGKSLTPLDETDIKYGNCLNIKNSDTVRVLNPQTIGAYSSGVVINSDNVTIDRPYSNDNGHGIRIQSGYGTIINNAHSFDNSQSNICISPEIADTVGDITVNRALSKNGENFGYVIFMQKSYEGSGCDLGTVTFNNCSDEGSDKGLLLDICEAHGQSVSGSIQFNGLQMDGNRSSFVYQPFRMSEPEISLLFNDIDFEDQDDSKVNYLLEICIGLKTPRPITDINQSGLPIYTNRGGNAALTSVISASVALGQYEVQLGDGTFTLGSTFTIPNNVILVGNGKHRTRLLGSSSANGFQFLRFNNVQNGGVKFLLLDCNSRNRPITNSSNGGIEFSNNCYNHVVQDVHLMDFGPGNYMTISAQETDLGSTHDIFLNGVILQDDRYMSKFGFRFYTEFMTNKPDDEFSKFVYNITMKNCIMNGFVWNPVEIVGPATTDCLVEDCECYNTRGYGAFEADKGPKRITFNRCYVDGMYDNGVSDDPTVVQGQMMAFRSWGGLVSDGFPYQRFCYGNVFTNNVARRVKNEKENTLTAACVINHSTDCVVNNNTFEDIRYGSPDFGIGVILMGNTSGIEINDNRMVRIRTGVHVVGGSNVDDIDIQGNYFSDMEMAYKSYTAGTKNDIQFFGNELKQDSILISKTNETNSTFTR